MRSITVGLVLMLLGVGCSVELTTGTGSSASGELSVQERWCRQLARDYEDVSDDWHDALDDLNDALVEVDAEAIEAAYRAAVPIDRRIRQVVDQRLQRCAETDVQVENMLDLQAIQRRLWDGLMERCGYAPEVFGRTICQ